jgi:hypothetical protein
MAYMIYRKVIFWNETEVLGQNNLVPEMPFIKYLSDLTLCLTTVAENVGKFLSNVFPERKRT